MTITDAGPHALEACTLPLRNKAPSFIYRKTKLKIGKLNCLVHDYGSISIETVRTPLSADRLHLSQKKKQVKKVKMNFNHDSQTDSSELSFDVVDSVSKFDSAASGKVSP